MKKILYIIALFCLLFLGHSTYTIAADYVGRVVDTDGQSIPFATIYLEAKPEVGTASGNEGQFTLSTTEARSSQVIVSFIGYQTVRLRLSEFAAQDTLLIRLKEQPIELQDLVVSARKPRIVPSKRKQMKYLLERVYQRMQNDFPEDATRYNIVSDVRMHAESTPWGMEQMIADVVNLPKMGREESDSIQFAGKYCKRFFQQQIRDRANTILAGSKLDKDIRNAAYEIDSGVVVHKSLWAMGNVKYDFEQTMSDYRNWCLQDGENEIILTHTQRKNYLGIFKYTFLKHYVLDAENLSVKRFSEELQMNMNIPFGHKFTTEDLDLLNLLNMNEDAIQKFRLQKADANITLNTVYQRIDGTLYPLEKNLVTKAKMVGTKGQIIPVDLRATQHVTKVTPHAKPMKVAELTRRVSRQNVSIY